MADYPSSTPTFDTKVDYVSVVFADHVNKLQTELLATQTTLGTGVLASSGWTDTFDQVTSTWGSVKARLNNIEYGLDTAYNNRVSTDGGSTVESSATTVVNLKFKAISSQTSDLVQFANSSNSVISKVGSDGFLYTADKKLVPVIYASSQPSGVPAGTIWVDSTSDVQTMTFNGLAPDGGDTGQVLTKVSGTDYDFDWETIVIPEVGLSPFMLGGM